MLAKHSWQALAKNWLTDLKVEEISLVDSAACKQAVVAIKKRDGGGTDTYVRTKQPNGRYLFQKRAIPIPAELALPEYRANTDPVFNPLERPKEDEMSVMLNNKTAAKRKKKKFGGMMESIGKAGSTVTLLEQEAVVRKRAPRSRRRPECPSRRRKPISGKTST